MDRKTKIVGLTLTILLIAVVSFQYGGAVREASLDFDVGTNSVHVTVWIQRVGEEEPTLWDHHPGVLTILGKNYIEDQLGDTPSTDPAKWISVSTSVSAPSDAWTEIPAEIAAGGLTRAVGTYASTGDGVWTISYQFTATATHTDVQLCGFQYAVTGDGNLMWADIFTPVTLNDGDKLTITGTITVT